MSINELNRDSLIRAVAKTTALHLERPVQFLGVAPFRNDRWLSTTLALYGELSGCFTIEADTRFARRLASTVFRTEFADVQQADCADALVEFASSLASNLKSIVSQKDNAVSAVSISAPHRKSISISTNPHRLSFMCDDAYFEVLLQLIRTDGATALHPQNFETELLQAQQHL